MSGTITRFTWEPDPIVLANAINNVRLALLDRSLPLATAGEVMRASVRERFETETDPSGEKWAPWSEQYRPIAEAYPNIGILRQSGELYEAATSTEAIVVTSDTVFYQTPLLPHYGLAHEQGLPDRENPLPQRSFLGLSDESRLVIFGVFGEWFDRAIELYPTSTGKIGMRHAIRGAGGLFVTRASVGRGRLPVLRG